jgi:hypothetical protein
MIHMLDTLPERLREPVIERARELGYPTPDDYLLAMVEDALVEEVDDDDDDEAVDVVESLREAFADIKAGRVYSLDEMRAILKAERINELPLRLMERARELGYPTPDDYLVAIVEDALVEEVGDDEEAIDVYESIRQSLAEIKAGKFYVLNNGEDLDRLLDSEEFD